MTSWRKEAERTLEFYFMELMTSDAVERLGGGLRKIDQHRCANYEHRGELNNTGCATYTPVGLLLCFYCACEVFKVKPDSVERMGAVDRLRWSLGR